MRMLADATCPRRRIANLFALLALVLTVVALGVLFLAPPSSLARAARVADVAEPAVPPARANAVGRPAQPAAPERRHRSAGPFPRRPGLPSRTP